LVRTLGVLEAVCRDYHRAAFCGLFVYDFENEGARNDVQATNWFIQQQNVRFLSQALRHECSLTFTSGKFMKLTTR